MLVLRYELTNSLKEHFEDSKSKGREYLAATLVSKVESIVEELNRYDCQLGRSEYKGDKSIKIVNIGIQTENK